MTQEITRTDFGFSKATPKELDRVMLENNGVLGEAGPGIIPITSGDAKRHGWRTAHIGQEGTPESGRLILLPCNHFTAKTWRAGKANWFKQYGLKDDLIQKIFVSENINYRFEEGVAKAVNELVESGLSCNVLRAIYTTGKTWKARTGLRVDLPLYDSLSRRRQESAIEIACLVAPKGSESEIKIVL